MTKVIIKDDDDDSILKDGETRTVRLMMKDGKTPNPALTPAQRVAAAVAATRAAMTSFDSSMHKPGFRRAATGTADSAAYQSTRFGVYDGAREKAYSDRDREMSDAWESKSPPSGSYPAGNGCEERMECTINGAPGTLVAIDGQQGWLRCVADDDANNGDDVDTDDSATADAKAKAYAAYDSDIMNAWRNK